MQALDIEYRIDELRIDTASPLGEGGAAELHRCITPDGAAMVFKRYNEDARAKLDVAALRRLIEWPATLGPQDRQRLQSICAWPQAVVVENGSVIGVVMPQARARFFLHRKGKLEPCHVTRIAVRNDEAQKRGYPYFDFPHKIARLGHLLSELEFLHSKGIVIGDLQPNNILTTAPQPDDTGTISTANYLVDCDSFIVDGRGAFPLMDPMSWRPPYAYNGFSATTDLFKFALLVIRCLSEHLAADAIQFDKYREILPSADFEKLGKLLTSPTPGLTSADLSNMARAWQSSVKPDGRMYRRTDASHRERWTQQIRSAHLAGVQPPAARLAPPAPLARLERVMPPPAPAVSGNSSGTGFSRQAWLVAAAIAAILVVIVIGEIAANTGGNGGRSSTSSTTTYMTPTTSATQTTYSAAPTTSEPVLSSAGRDVWSANVGECIHQTRGAESGDGTYDVTVSYATCGTTYATDRVVARTDNGANCSGSYVFNRYSPPVVLCLVPD